MKNYSLKLKIPQARLQQYVNRELPDVQAGFRKGRRTRDQIANTHWIIEKAREFQKNTYFCFIDYAKAFDCVDHNKLWKILKEMGIPDHLTCLLRNLNAGDGRPSLSAPCALTGPGVPCPQHPLASSGPVSPGASGMQPRDPCRPWRGTLASGHKPR